MQGSAVSGATDYYFQLIIIVICAVLGLYGLLLLLGVYFRHKDREQKIIEDFHRTQQNNFIGKNNSLGQGSTISYHILTVYSDEPVVIEKYKDGKLVESRTGFYSVDEVTFDETEDTHIDNVIYYHPEEVIEELDNADCDFVITPHEESAIAQDYKFKISERYLPPILNPEGVKLIKVKFGRENHDYLYLFETMYYFGKRIELVEQ